MELNLDEIRDIRAYDNDFNPENVQSTDKSKGQAINDILIISNGRGELHDSGYPFIKVLGRQYKQGVISPIKYFHLGWHDHCLCNIPVNIDSYGKNIFRIMPHFSYKNFVVSPHFISVSTFEVGCVFKDIMPQNSLS
jgi:hypothetical protein